MGIITPEVLYPSTGRDRRSATSGRPAPPDPVIHQPSAAVFNGTMLVTGALVLVAAYFVLFSGSITVLLSSRVVVRPFAYLCAALGGISLPVLLSVFVYGLVVSGPSPLEPLGPGGIERWVAYPLPLWVPAMGGCLLGGADPSPSRRR